METQLSNTPRFERRTLRVEDVQNILGVGRSMAYNLVRSAAAAGEPFKVMRIGSTLLVSKKSFDDYLEQNGI